ncbi:hypothetical protein O6H91_11G060500 [Diphasiastrum complanatum]|uniref:Uncharacterized protein n=1 Tax=Diphasiastrum complanatum TaxID=34168 RepID=A0ACC2CA13_DIPCM|nr:hypothetical protein O6H91_11G060500 [Diphasiastrum complanatum]
MTNRGSGKARDVDGDGDGDGGREGETTLELYHMSSIGRGLVEALDEMVFNGTISPLLAAKVLKQFDKSIIEALRTKVHSKIRFKGHLDSYRYCDSVWTFDLKNASFKTDNGDVQAVDRIKIVACDAACAAIKSRQL